YFYTFNGLQGDLELTVESSNLDGDIDVFLAGNLRPLAKITLYAGGSPTRVTKSVYLRREEPLILRVQARTPNDAEGIYRVMLGGAFRPADRLAASDAASSGETLAASPTPTPARSADKKVRRVTSTGARIDEPVAEVAVKEEPAKEAETPESPAVAPRRTPARPRPARGRAGTRGNTRAQTARRTPPATETGGDAEKGDQPKPEDKAESDAAAASERSDTSAEEKPATAKPERARPVRVPRARNNRNTTARRTGAPPAEVVPTVPEETPAPPAPSPRLVIIMRDGETFVRDMSSVRRVTVEKGMIVITSKNGTINRQPMSDVLRMSIEP
ncbi:MAG TPA: hypothetical protein VGO96_21825, partial [Pyrinomonadaceae bacterium]|nr:hypothetical protein [Pyrinomonadaceae bacterium]